jgi:hypothetical protein
MSTSLLKPNAMPLRNLAGRLVGRPRFSAPPGSLRGHQMRGFSQTWSAFQDVPPAQLRKGKVSRLTSPRSKRGFLVRGLAITPSACGLGLDHYVDEDMKEKLKRKDAEIKDKDAEIKEKDAQINEKNAQIQELKKNIRIQGLQKQFKWVDGKLYRRGSRWMYQGSDEEWYEVKTFEDLRSYWEATFG